MSRQATQLVQSTESSAPAPGEGSAQRSTHLDASLDRAHRLAVGQQHRGVTSEHLLFALTEDAEALGVLGASTVSIERLRADIGTHLGQLPGDAPAGKPILPSADLLKVLKLSAMAAQQSARRQIDGAIVLAAMIGDASTPSAGLLRAHGLTFDEVIRVLQKGTASASVETPAAIYAPVRQPTNAATVEEMVEPPPAAERAVAAPPMNRTEAAKKVVSDIAATDVQASLPASTDELLTLVRARLQQTAPAKPRPVERPAVDDPPAVSVDGPTPAVMPEQPDRPMTPDDLGRASAASVAERMPPVVLASPSPTPPPERQQGAADPQTVSAAVPKLPSITAPTPRNMPPPLPLPTPSSPPVAPQNLPQFGLRPQPVHRVPPIPPPSIDLRALMSAVGKQMRQGETTVIEITVPRRILEIPMAPGHRWPPLRVATMRLRAPADSAHVELASPETLWISPPRVHQGAADDATWRWRVTPRVEGIFKLNLAGATRIVGGEGISGEVPLGEETIEIDVLQRGSRRGLVGFLLFGNLLALGVLAMVMSGRAGELLATAWTAARGVLGGG